MTSSNQVHFNDQVTELSPTPPPAPNNEGGFILRVLWCGAKFAVKRLLLQNLPTIVLTCVGGTLGMVGGIAGVNRLLTSSYGKQMNDILLPTTRSEKKRDVWKLMGVRFIKLTMYCGGAASGLYLGGSIGYIVGSVMVLLRKLAFAFKVVRFVFPSTTTDQ